MPFTVAVTTGRFVTRSILQPVSAMANVSLKTPISITRVEFPTAVVTVGQPQPR